DSKTLATLVSDSTFRVWDINNPSNPIKTTSRPDLSRDMTISPDGKTLALSSSMVSSASSQSTAIDLWDFPDLKGPPQKLPGTLRITSGHAFSPDGRLIAVGVSIHGQTNFKPNSQVAKLTNPAVEIWDLTKPEAKPILLAGED